MAETKVIMPQMGESIFEGTLTKWLKKPGDKIERDEALFEISTDKVDSEIPSPASGVLQEILVKEGQTVQINTVVAIIGDGSGKASAASPAAKTETKPTPAATVAAPARTDAAPVSDEERMPTSPLVRRLAKEHNIDLAVLAGKGTGINGRITKDDILSYIENSGRSGSGTAKKSPLPTPAPMTFSGETERAPMTAMRKSIAEHMMASRRTSAHVTTFFEIDCSRIMQAREKLKAEFETSGVHLTITPFFVQAVVRALRKFPIVNASIDGDSIVYKRGINIGIAVSLDGGLIVPVVKNAAEKNLQGLAHAINDLGERARTKKLTPDDVKDGTFTITNPGVYGALTGTPIINQPQVAIMGMGGIKKRAVVIDDAIAIRPIIVLSLSFDHRLIDGALADQFMADIQKQLETWQG
ncbi:MAG TPA: dihydrolipoyllysine-residue succinyltransferase [Terriglobia bacterium]|nr:dihydrolipoyllysine-residue succinyltransferase [Terriglobia bacterium]